MAQPLALGHRVGHGVEQLGQVATDLALDADGHDRPHRGRRCSCAAPSPRARPRSDGRGATLGEHPLQLAPGRLRSPRSATASRPCANEKPARIEPESRLSVLGQLRLELAQPLACAARCEHDHRDRRRRAARATSAIGIGEHEQSRACRPRTGRRSRRTALPAAAAAGRPARACPRCGSAARPVGQAAGEPTMRCIERRLGERLVALRDERRRPRPRRRRSGSCISVAEAPLDLAALVARHEHDRERRGRARRAATSSAKTSFAGLSAVRRRRAA